MLSISNQSLNNYSDISKISVVISLLTKIFHENFISKDTNHIVLNIFILVYEE